MEDNEQYSRLLTKGHMDSLMGLAFSPDNKYFAISHKYYIDMHLAETGELLYKLEGAGHSWGNYCIEFSPDSRSLLVGSDLLSIWDVKSGKKIKAIDIDQVQHTGIYNDLSWSPRGDHFASASNIEIPPNHQSALIWDVEDGAFSKHLEGFTSQKSRLSWSPDGRLLGVSSYGRSPLAQVIDADDGMIL